MRKKRLSKIAAVSLVVSLCVGSLVGCGKKKEEKSASKDLYSVMQEAQDLTSGNFEMTLGMESPKEDEFIEITFSGVTTEESFDIEVALNVDADGDVVKGSVAQLIYEDEHLYINAAKTVEFLNMFEEIGTLSDFGIDTDYIDIYVGDIYEQTDKSAAGEMADLFIEIIEDAAVNTDKKEGAAKDGNIEFKDTDVVAFLGELAQSVKDSSEDIVDISAEMSNISYDYNAIIDYYGDMFEEYGIDVDEMKDELDTIEEVELTDEEKEVMVEKIEATCDGIIEGFENPEDADAKGSKIVFEASMDGKKGSRTYEFHFDLLAASESDGDEVRFYADYVFEEGEGKVKVPKDSLEMDELMEVLEPFYNDMIEPNPSIMEPDVDDPTATSNDLLNEDGSYAVSCSWGCSSGRVDFFAPEGFEIDSDFSREDFQVYTNSDYNSMYLFMYDGESYLESYDYESLMEKGELPTGTISTPVGEMAYIIDNTESFYTLHGFVTIDAEHYLKIEYTIYSSDEPTVEKGIQYLTTFAQGLKPVQ